jgi:hypothetical protein
VKIVLRDGGALTTSVRISREDDPLEVLAEWPEPWSTAELHDERKVCWKRAVFMRNGVGWKYTMDRTGQYAPRPAEAEQAKRLEEDVSLVLAHLAREERRARGRPFEMPDWPAVVRALVSRGLVKVHSEGGELTRLGRAVAYELIDQGY